MEWLAIWFCVIVGISIFLGWYFTDSPKAVEEKNQKAESDKSAIKNLVKSHFNKDFDVSFNIGKHFAIDKMRDAIFLEYEENTIDYFAYVKPNSIISYSLKEEYESRSTGKRAAVGAVLGGATEALIGAASAQNGKFMGWYLSISLTINGKTHYSYTRCGLEEGRWVIRYLDQAKQK